MDRTLLRDTGKRGAMCVPAVIFADEGLRGMEHKGLLAGRQCRHAPGHREPLLCDAGYALGLRFPIGGVAAFDPEQDSTSRAACAACTPVSGAPTC